MRCTDIQDQAAALAVGALARAEAARVEALAAHDADVAAEVAELHDAAAAAAAALTRKTAPPAALREAVLSRVTRTPQVRPPVEGDVIEGFTFHRAGEGPWLPTPVPGFRIKVLSFNRETGYQTVLVDLDAGAIIPDHDHTGCEDIYVLSGDLATEGRTLGPGDSIHGRPGSHHHALFSRNGCMAMMTYQVVKAA